MTPDLGAHPGPYLRQLIDKTGSSQATVATRIGVTTKHLNQILQERALPSIVVTIALAQVLDADPHEMWRMVADHQMAKALNARQAPD